MDTASNGIDPIADIKNPYANFVESEFKPTAPWTFNLIPVEVRTSNGRVIRLSASELTAFTSRIEGPMLARLPMSWYASDGTSSIQWKTLSLSTLPVPLPSGMSWDPFRFTQGAGQPITAALDLHFDLMNIYYQNEIQSNQNQLHEQNSIYLLTTKYEPIYGGNYGTGHLASHLMRFHVMDPNLVYPSTWLGPKYSIHEELDTFVHELGHCFSSQHLPYYEEDGLESPIAKFRKMDFDANWSNTTSGMECLSSPYLKVSIGTVGLDHKNSTVIASTGKDLMSYVFHNDVKRTSTWVSGYTYALWWQRIISGDSRDEPNHTLKSGLSVLTSPFVGGVCP